MKITTKQIARLLRGAYQANRNTSRHKGRPVQVAAYSGKGSDPKAEKAGNAVSDRLDSFRKVFVFVPTDTGPKQESLWAIQVSADTARIDSIPFFTAKVGSGDLVRVSDCGEVTEVLERVTRTRCARYDAASDLAAAKREWQIIREHVGLHKIECESAIAGVFSMAVPIDLSEDSLREVAATCPVQLTAPTEPSLEQFQMWRQLFTSGQAR